MRRECWIWTAVVEEEGGGRWTDCEVGDRSEDTFLKLSTGCRRLVGVR